MTQTQSCSFISRRCEEVFVVVVVSEAEFHSFRKLKRVIFEVKVSTFEMKEL